MIIRRIYDFEKKEGIKIIGIGGGGSNVINELFKSGCKYHLISITTEYKTFPLSDTKIVLGLKTNKGLKSNCNLEIAKKCFNEDIDEVENVIFANHIILVAGLSHGTGTACVPLIAKLIKKTNDDRSAKIKVYVVVTTPFNFEMIFKDPNVVVKSVKELQKLERNNIIDKLVVIDAESLNNKKKSDSSLTSLFDKLNKREIEEILKIINSIEEELENKN